jgi:hypothetical protein
MTLGCFSSAKSHKKAPSLDEAFLIQPRINAAI